VGDPWLSITTLSTWCHISHLVSHWLVLHFPYQLTAALHQTVCTTTVVVRLDQCCRELMEAARVMGNTALFALMEAASGLIMIRRDSLATILYVA
jgi:hypothetical protein